MAESKGNNKQEPESKEKKDKEEKRKPDPKEPFCGLVFKIVADTHGELFYVRIYSGTLKANSRVYDATRDGKELVSKLFYTHADPDQREDVPSAQQYLSRALDLNPRLPLALNTMGVVFARQGDFAHAVEYWSRAVAIDPHQYDALYNIGLVEGRAGHRAEARAALQKFVNTAPKERYAADIETARRALTALP